MKRSLQGHALDFVVGLLVTAVLLGLVEASLWALGRSAPERALDFSRGFDPRAQYLVPDPDVPGGWRTQFAEGRLKEVVIPPRDDRTRVLLFGGSNTDNFPAAELGRQLNQGTELSEPNGADVTYEVINLGRSGYGSGRVSILFEQALEKLSPDAVVIYSGHNEFVEQSFQIDLDRVWSSPLERTLGRWASRSRVIQAVEDALALEAPEPGPKRPEAWTWEYQKFSGLAWEQTVEAYERYRHNLSLMCQQAGARDVRVLLCTVVYNDLAPPFESTPPADWSEDQRARFAADRKKVRAALPEWLEPLAPRTARGRVVGPDWRAPAERRPDPPRTGPVPGMRECLGALAAAQRSLPKSKRWDVKIWALYDALERLWAERTPAEREVLEEHASRLEELLEVFPEHSDTLYELGVVQLALGSGREAVEGPLRAASRFDRAPRKGNPMTNQVVRDVAASHAGVELVDAEQIFRERMPLGLVGWEWMKDHCHLNEGACVVFMADLAARLRAGAGD